MLVELSQYRWDFAFAAGVLTGRSAVLAFFFLPLHFAYLKRWPGLAFLIFSLLSLGLSVWL